MPQPPYLPSCCTAGSMEPASPCTRGPNTVRPRALSLTGCSGLSVMLRMRPDASSEKNAMPRLTVVPLAGSSRRLGGTRYTYSSHKSSSSRGPFHQSVLLLCVYKCVHNVSPCVYTKQHTSMHSTALSPQGVRCVPKGPLGLHIILCKGRRVLLTRQRQRLSLLC